jgi:hypothetical protein
VICPTCLFPNRPSRVFLNFGGSPTGNTADNPDEVPGLEPLVPGRMSGDGGGSGMPPVDVGVNMLSAYSEGASVEAMVCREPTEDMLYEPGVRGRLSTARKPFAVVAEGGSAANGGVGGALWRFGSFVSELLKKLVMRFMLIGALSKKVDLGLRRPAELDLLEGITKNCA